MKLRFLYILLFLFLSFSCFAQAPGYMGKKLTIYYGFGFSPAMRGPTTEGAVMPISEYTDNYGVHEQLLAFNNTHSLGADYVVARLRTVGIEVARYKTMALFNRSMYVKSPYANPNSFEPYDLVNMQGGAQITANRFSVFTKRFGKNYVAPWGRYTRWEAFALAHRSVYDTLKMVSYNPYNPYTENNTGDGDVTNISFGVGFEFGKQRVLFHNLVLNYSVRMAHIFGAAKTLRRNPGINLERYAYWEERYIRSTAVERLFRHELLTVRLGVGLLR